MMKSFTPHPMESSLIKPEANRLAIKENIIILCGHYKGIDQRVRDHLITLEISIGDYVLTGGELAAAVIAMRGEVVARRHVR